MIRIMDMKFIPPTLSTNITFLSGGKTGINETNPLAQLHVKGSVIVTNTIPPASPGGSRANTATVNQITIR